MTKEEFSEKMVDLLNEFHLANGSRLEFLELLQLDGSPTPAGTLAMLMNFKVQPREELNIEQIVNEVNDYFVEMFQKGDENESD